MKVVIFAGGIGSRITEESHLKPKPMIEIGDKPILWHIMKIYSSQGFNDFIICLGYKGFMIKEYFLNYYLHNSDITINLNNNNVEAHYSNTESFKVTLIDTGLDTKTAGRLSQVREHLGDEDFMLTYGDGVADINLHNLLKFHKNHGKIATITAVKPPPQYGGMQINEDGRVGLFREKPKNDQNWINGGFFVLKSNVFDYLKEDADKFMWEDYPLEDLSKDNQLYAFKHYGFWKCMDAMRDKMVLDELWNTNKAKWKTWE
jgi:glucose-1-phosphate cytidylyltransferase